MPSSAKEAARGLLPAFLVLATPLVAGAFVSGVGWSWGWDQLHRAAPLWTGFLFLLGILLWVPPIRAAAERAAAEAGRRLEGGRRIVPLVLSLLGLAAFAAFPIATRMYGDSQVIVNDHTPQHLAIYVHRMLTFGLNARASANFAMHDVLSRLTGLSFERTFMLVSALCGGIFLFTYARFAAALPDVPPWARAAILWIGITDGANQMFFGHIEAYIVPRLFECLFLIEVARSLLDPERRPRKVRTVLFLVLAVVFHSQALVLLATGGLWAAYHIARRYPSLRPWAGGRMAVIGISAAVLGLAAAYVAFGSYCYDPIYSGGRPHPRQLFMPISAACMELPYLHYTLFSGAHLLDILGSLYSITSPAVILVVALFLPAAWGDERTVILAASIATAFIHDFILNSAIGFPFDWDLMSIVSPPLLFTAVFLLARCRAPAPPRGLVPAIVFLGLGSATWFGVNASRDRVYHRVEDMGIWLHDTYYGGSHYRLGANLSTISDPKRQIAERQRVQDRLVPHAFPNDREVAFLWERLAIKNIEIEDYAAALPAYRKALETEPSRWDREKPVGYLESEVGDLNEGIRLLSDYCAREPRNAEGWLFLGDAYARTGSAADAQRCWTSFVTLDPSAPEVPRVREDLRKLRDTGRLPKEP